MRGGKGRSTVGVQARGPPASSAKRMTQNSKRSVGCGPLHKGWLASTVTELVGHLGTRSGGGGSVLHVSSRKGTTACYSVRADGAEAKRLWEDEETAAIAIVRQIDSAEAGRSSVYGLSVATKDDAASNKSYILKTTTSSCPLSGNDCRVCTRFTLSPALDAPVHDPDFLCSCMRQSWL